MFNQHSGEMFRRRYREEPPLTNLHNVGPLSQKTDGAQSPDESGEPSRRQSQEFDGTWGERDVGGPVNREQALAEFDEIRREISKISLQRTVSRESGAEKARTWLSRGRSRPSLAQNRTTISLARSETTDATWDKETGPEPVDEDDLDLGAFLKDGHFEKRTEAGDATKKVGVLYRNLTVKGVGAQATFTKTLPEAIMGTFGPDLYRLATRFVPALHFGKPPPTRNLLHDFSGTVRDGEMMLVLGRPGSGCSTFLKVVANQRESFAGVEGIVTYGGISAEEQKKRYRGEVNYNPEDDQHLPNLTVWQTLKFALMNKTKKHDASTIPVIIDALLRMFGISHTKDTLVGNEYVRGVSGGERKRVGIAETLATKSTVVCWDNSTRGLDASTALDYARSLRVMTDISNRTTFVTLYQAGEGIYEVMDKVLVIEEGRMIYQGPADRARQYFIDLGFHSDERQTTADFLTSVGDPNERQFRKDMEASTPKTADELEAAFRKSEFYKEALADVVHYENELKASQCSDTRNFQDAVQDQKSNSKLVSSQSSYTVSFWRQVLACTLREFWLFWGDKSTLYTKVFIIISNALIVGSLFYGESLDTSGAFPRGGALFFSILFLGWLQLTELVRAVSGRVVISRHHDYAFYRPSAVVIARVMLDLPVLAVQAVVFTVILYFMANLDLDAGKFFINLLFVYLSTICITALYRMFAALSPTIDDAVRFSGIALNLLIIFVGYTIPKTILTGKVIWFGWLYYVNPVSYSYEAVLTNEFSGRLMECSASNLVPRGPGAVAGYQGCSLTGATVGTTQVSGDAYFENSFGYYRSHLWRNFGVVIAWTVLYILINALASEVFSFAGGGGGALIFKKTRKAKKMVNEETKPADEEKAGPVEPVSSGSSESVQKPDVSIAQSKSVFTWENVNYEVPYQGGLRKLLNGVNGYVKPGVMIALMGASGAGKTTLLNTLSQRQTMGTVAGDMLVDGRPLGIEFQRGTGFCEQMDLHDETATIREALEFSAILRQDRNVPKQEKLDYVQNIIELLELHDIEDAIIGSLGVEQRKRLTIGVELAAKPELLLFLDEPTSGLDSQSAFSIVRFLKKLSQAGQAIICTIHQPSSMLIQQFDMVLALNPGGNPFYFGPIGENGAAVIDYFAKRGTQCPPNKNVAEFILETAAKGGKRREDGKRVNWNKEWLESEENAALLKEIHRLKEERSKETPKETKDQHEFAAPVQLQTYELMKRTFRNYWRDPSYLYAKFFVSVVIGIFNGFTFYNLNDSVASLQERFFTSFLILLIPPTIVNGVVPKFYQNRALWEAREYPSRIYGWFAFCTAQVVAEIPTAVISSVIYWLLWYYPTNLPRDNETAGYMFLMTMLFYFFMSSWGQWICAFAPSFTVISNTLPFFFVMVSIFNGIVRPYSQLPVFWRYWMYYVNPSTWWLRGVLSATLKDLTVRCAQGESTLYNAPPGQTCQSYTQTFIQSSGMGYVNTMANGTCAYCPFANGEQYLSTLNTKPNEQWRDFGIFLVFTFSNWFLVYFFIWSVRVKKWTFGMSSLFAMAEKGVDAVKGLFSRKQEET
ncbi:ATP-binding cassette transporter snq2 [Cladophialophora chaetospira]|uniref:ABC multidrug transporter atrF n=1 Tax=Cladophialophora chaetospira TaxID=386627 RepID=A0AA38XBD7_9EURO|nr:ATP-binding cassette transporter snq2 [Cladophialophora chaetospira]